MFGDSKTVNSLNRDISWIQQKHVSINIKNSTNAFHLVKCLVISLLPIAVATFKFHLLTKHIKHAMQYSEGSDLRVNQVLQFCYLFCVLITFKLHLYMSVINIQ